MPLSVDIGNTPMMPNHPEQAGGVQTTAPEKDTGAPPNQIDLNGGQQPSAPPTNPAPEQAPAPLSQQAIPTAPAQGGGAQLIMGEQQAAAVAQMNALAELRAKLHSGVRDFWLNPGEFAKLVFLDGTLLDDGVTFDTPMLNTHGLRIGQRWEVITCNKHTEANCVICDSNGEESTPDTVQLFTVINTMPWTYKKGEKKGQTIPARLMLFAAKPGIREKLVKRAQNHGGKLKGGFYQFSRSSKQSPRTGDDVEFLQEVDLGATLQKFPMLGSVKDAKGEWKDAPTTLISYPHAYPILTNAEIAALRPDIGSMAGIYQPPVGGGGGALSGQVPPPTGGDDGLPF